jgi:hypothetical protein
MSSWFDTLLPELRLLVQHEMPSVSRARLAGTCKRALAEDTVTWLFPPSWQRDIYSVAGTRADAHYLMRHVKALGWADWPQVERTLGSRAVAGDLGDHMIGIALYWPMEHSWYIRLSTIVFLPTGTTCIRGSTVLPIPAVFVPTGRMGELHWTDCSLQGWLHDKDGAQELMQRQCEALAALPSAHV